MWETVRGNFCVYNILPYCILIPGKYNLEMHIQIDNKVSCTHDCAPTFIQGVHSKFDSKSTVDFSKNSPQNKCFT